MRNLVACALLIVSVVFGGQGGWRAAAVAHAASIADTAAMLSVNGYTRRFTYAVSTQPAPAAGRPLLIQLHGDGGDMGLSAAWKSAVLGDSNGAVLISAQGRNNIPAAAAIDGSAWRFRMDETGQPYDDTDFIVKLIAQATASTSLLGTAIDPQQVYVVGESRGAGFAYYLYADPRTRNTIRAIVPISGTFYCDGEAVPPAGGQEGDPGTTVKAGSDRTCGDVSADTGWYWGPRASLFTGATRTPHILDIHGQPAPAGGEDPYTAPPALDVDYGASSWSGWGEAAGCYTVRVSAQTERTLPAQVGGLTVKSYAFSQSADALGTRCAGLDLTFLIAQGGGHVPGGFEPTAWCFLSTVGGTPSTSACVGNPQQPGGNGPALSVDVAASRKPISPEIYGLHEADETFAREIGLPVRRYGGNLATRYNWRTNNTNSGLDYYFANRPADISATDFVARDRRTGTKSILTIPMTGWVAKDDTNATCGFSTARYAYTPKPYGGLAATNPDYPACGTGVTGETPGGTLTFPPSVNPADTSVAFAPADAQVWIASLKAAYGAAAQGGVPYYALDNEPDLWSGTHADLVPTALTYQQFRDRTYAYAAAVKAADAGAKTLGPSLGSYSYFFNSFYDGQREDWATPDDRNANGGTPFLAWYLQQMRAYEQQHGTRILDYLDVHWYPQDGSYGSPAGDGAQQAARLASVRSLWDPTYVDDSWIKDAGPDGGIVQLIPRLRALAAANYPGTKIAISEYSWGAHADLNGALAQADILGVFGREGVDLATLFDGRYEADNAKFAPNRPSAYAFRMYRNYDGQGGRFGETSVQASSADQSKLAIYAAQRSDGALTVMVINKTKGALSSSVGLGGFAPGASASVFRYSAANLSAIAREPSQPIAGGSFTASFPAESITLLVVPGTGGGSSQQPRIWVPLVQR